MTHQYSLIPEPPRCEACEAPLLEKENDDHIQPAYICCNTLCSQYGKCKTCMMLLDWFQRVDAE